MSKPYYDEWSLQVPGVPEIREYRMRWWDDGSVNGDLAAVQKINVGP